MTRLVLASGSPQRRDLLRAAGYAFEAIRPDDAAECGLCSGESPPEMVLRLARQKAGDVVTRLRREGRKDAIVIGCDTVAEWAGQSLGKPRDEPHARGMLETLRGREHRVYSGLCVWPTAGNNPLERIERTTLRMASLSDKQLEEYLASDLWVGKAGAFGYQDRHGWLEILDGSETNVIGLPMEVLAELLSKLGIQPAS